MKFERQTRRLYDSHPYLCETSARIIKIGADFLELDATVAFPEGGGQESTSA